MKKELDMIELDNGIKLPVIDAINYQDRIFLLVGILNEKENNIGNELYVYEKKNNEILILEDNDLLEKLMRTFEKRMNL